MISMFCSLCFQVQMLRSKFKKVTSNDRPRTVRYRQNKVHGPELQQDFDFGWAGIVYLFRNVDP